MTASIVQFVGANGTGDPTTGFSLGSPVTAGNLLVMLSHKFRPENTTPFEVFLNDGTTGRPFTLFSGSPFYQNTAGGNYFDTRLAYRIATGDEQTLRILNQAPGNDYYFTLYEIAGAGNPATFSVISVSGQAASTSKVIGTLADPGDVQIMALTYGIASGGDRPLDQSAGAGWTMDVQDGKPTGGSNYILNYCAASSTSGPVAQFSGGSVIWGGSAVGITSGVREITSVIFLDMPLIDNGVFQPNGYEVADAFQPRTY